MTIHFAAARSRKLSTMARVLAAPVRRIAANDNGRHTAHYTPFADNAVLRSTLRHFAEHGLAAAERARENAERAIFAGDRDQYNHWLAICRALDRRMAAAFSAQRGEA